MNTKNKGDVTEAVILAALIKAGGKVLLPFGDNLRYDMAIDLDGKFIRIQCKTARPDKIDGASIGFRCCSQNPFTSKRRTYKGSADFFGVYAPQIDKIYFVAVDRAPADNMIIRIKQSKNRQSSVMNIASDFEFTGNLELAFSSFSTG